MTEAFKRLRQSLPGHSVVTLAHLLAAREDFSRIVKTSSGASRDKTRCAVNKVRTGRLFLGPRLLDREITECQSWPKGGREGAISTPCLLHLHMLTAEATSRRPPFTWERWIFTTRHLNVVYFLFCFQN